MEGLLAFIQPFTVPVGIRERHERGEAISARSREPVQTSLRKTTQILHLVGDLARVMATTEDLSTFRSADEIEKVRVSFADFLFHLTTREENAGDEWYVGHDLWSSYVETKARTEEAIEALLVSFDEEVSRLGHPPASVEQQAMRQEAMDAVASIQQTAEQTGRLSHEQIDQIIDDHRAGKS